MEHLYLYFICQEMKNKPRQKAVLTFTSLFHIWIHLFDAYAATIAIITKRLLSATLLKNRIHTFELLHLGPGSFPLLSGHFLSGIQLVSLRN